MLCIKILVTTQLVFVYKTINLNTVPTRETSAMLRCVFYSETMIWEREAVYESPHTRHQTGKSSSLSFMALNTSDKTNDETYESEC